MDHVFTNLEPHVLAALEPGEELRHRARATDAVIAVTDRRLVVAAQNRVALSVPFQSVRRIQFDIERKRPATLVIVPEERTYEPQVLAIEPSGFEAIARALVTVGLRFAGPTDEEQQTG